jgi:hypothetical protein
VITFFAITLNGAHSILSQTFCEAKSPKNHFQLTTPIHEEQKLKLIGANLSFEGPSTLTQFSIISVNFAEQKNDSKVEVEIQLQRIFSYHLTNTYMPTAR